MARTFHFRLGPLNLQFSLGKAAGTGVGAAYTESAVADLQGSQAVAALYGRLAVLYAAVYAIANTAAPVPLKVYRRRRSGTLDETTDHPLEDRLEHPNPFTSGYELREETFAFLALLGNHYWYLEGGEQLQIPTEIAPLKPWRVRPIPDPRTYVSGYVIGENENPVDPFSIVHHRAFNPTSDIIGQGAVQPAADAIIGDLYAQTFNKNFFVNGATLQGVLSTKLPLTDEAAARMAKAFNLEHRGAANAWKWRVVGGGLEPKPMQPTHTDMDFGNLRRMSREEILVALGVPPVKVGLLDGATYANANEQDRTFWRNTILPKLARFEAVVNRDLAVRYGPDVEAHHDLTDVDALKDQMDVISTVGAVLFGDGAITANEWREWMNTRRMPVLDPIPEEHGDTFYLPVSQLPVTGELADQGAGLAAPTPETPPAEGTPPPEESTGAAPPTRAGGGKAGRPLLRRAATRKPRGRAKENPPAPANPWDQVAAAIKQAEGMARQVLTSTEADAVEQRRVQQWKVFETRRRGHERAFRVTSRRVFKSQEAGVLAVLPQALEELHVQPAPAAAGTNGPQPRPIPIVWGLQVERAVAKGDHVGDAEAMNKLPHSIRDVFTKLAKQNADAYRKTYRQTIEASGKEAMAGLEVGTPFSLVTVETLSFLEVQGARLVKNTDLFTQKQIALEIAKGIAEGDSVLGISDRVKDVFTQAGRVRANAIARTESVKSFNFGTMEGYRQSGVVEGKEWLTARDSEVRGNDPHDDFDHVSADGQVVPLGASFDVSGEMLDYPGDPAGSAGNVIQCRCTVLPKLTGEAEE